MYGNLYHHLFFWIELMYGSFGALVVAVEGHVDNVDVVVAVCQDTLCSRYYVRIILLHID